jgi:hypothetical protein
VKARVLTPALDEIAEAALWFDSQRADDVQIISVAHVARRSGYWLSRISRP